MNDINQPVEREDVVALDGFWTLLNGLMTLHVLVKPSRMDTAYEKEYTAVFHTKENVKNMAKAYEHPSIYGMSKFPHDLKILLYPII